MAVPEPTDAQPSRSSAGVGEWSDDVRDPGPAAGPDDIEVRLPASPAHVPVVRALAADVAVRLDYDLDEVSDLRMAVDEACAEVVALAGPQARMTCVFRVTDESLWVTASAPTVDGAALARNTFGWKVLTALVDEVDAWTDDTQVTHVRLAKRRRGPVS